MLPKSLSDVSLPDVQTLCDNHALETLSLDFKAEAIGGGDREKREFLADVCAFANAAGGDLILGVKEEDGTAKEVCGIDIANPDEEKQSLVNLIRDGLEPRYSGLDMKWLPMSETRGVMILRVPRSWSAPHRVTFIKDMKFGSVATILAHDARGAVGELSPPDRSCGAVEQVGDDDGLAPDIMTVNLSKLSLPHHRHRFETRQSSPRGMETAEAEPRPDKALDTPVVLLDDVVEVLALPQTGAAR
jgi:Putative DNA-binding domain